MKAREMKKLLEKEYDSRIKSYKSIKNDSIIKIEVAKAQVREVEFVLEFLFSEEKMFEFED